MNSQSYWKRQIKFLIKKAFKSIKEQPFVGGMRVEVETYVSDGVACFSSIFTFCSLTAFNKGHKAKTCKGIVNAGYNAKQSCSVHRILNWKSFTSF